MKKGPLGEKSVSSQITNKKIILSIIVGFLALLYIEIEGQQADEKIKTQRIAAVVLPLLKCKEAQDVALWSNCQGKQLFPNGEKYAGTTGAYFAGSIKSSSSNKGLSSTSANLGLNWQFL